MSGFTFTCAACGGAFTSTWSDDEALAEAEAIFGAASDEDLDVVCDDCFKRLVPREVREP